MADITTNTLLEGLTQPMVQARVDSFDVRPFYFGTHFPVRKVSGFDWKTLSNQLQRRNVAADLHTDNGTVIRKRRPVFQSARGDIPYFAISREMERSDIKRYQQELADAGGDATKQALVNIWGDDVDFCFNGIQSEMEFVAWKLLTNAGRLAFTPATNASYANEFDLDYDVDPEQKVKTSGDWGDSAKADIVGDLSKTVIAAKARGLNPRFAFINLNELYRIQSAEQIIKDCASFAANALGIQQTPTLAQINSMLANQAWLNGLQLRVIDQYITREYQDGSFDGGNPFEDNVMVLSETETLGSTQYDILSDDNADAMIIRAVRSHTVVKKYGVIEPRREITIAEADAIPVLDTAYRNVYVRTDGKDWE